MSQESFVYTACPGWGDHDYCAIKTIVKDGKIVRTEKVSYEGPEAVYGHICQKGILSCRQPYNPNRLVQPLKRKEGTPRGGGEWEKISWDQALDEIAAKLDLIRNESGPEAVAWWSLPAALPPSMGLENVLARRFAAVFGATDPVNSIGLDNGPLFSHFYDFGSCMPSMDSERMIGAELIVVWGSNPIENQMRIAMTMVRAREAGARVVDIGLIFDGTAGFADEFVGAAAGSDGYLALAMANYVVSNELQNTEFLLAHSVAPYLVDVATGKHMRRGDDYLVWDEESGAAAAIPPKTAAMPIAKPALKGEFTVDGVVCKTAYTLLEEHLAPYTLEAAAGITRVDSATIARLAREFAITKNVYTFAALGLRYKNQGHTYRAIDLLAILCGHVGEQGNAIHLAGTASCYPLVLNDAPISQPLGLAGTKAVPIKMETFFIDASSPDNPYRAFIKTAGNPVHQQPDSKRWKAIFDKMDLVVDFDIWLTDTGELADYVLPDCMPFERMDIINMANYNHVTLQEPAIDPPDGCKTINYLLSGLASRLGLGEYFDKTDEEWLELRLQTTYPPVATLEPKLTLERLKKEKMVRMNVPAEPKFDMLAGLQLPTPTGKCEFYAERLADLGAALPLYTPVWESPVIGDIDSAYPFQLFTGRQRFFMQSMFTDDPINVELSGGEPYTRINPADAATKGLQDGEKVEVFNGRGHVVTKLELDESVPQGTLHVWFGWRARHFEEGTYSEMVTPICNPGIADELSDRWMQDWLAAGGIYYSPADFMSIEIASWDAYWDSAADIRKWDGAPTGKEA